MPTELQNRARSFLLKPIPENIGYVPGSIAEGIISAFARDGQVNADDETKELLQLTIMESENMADSMQHPEGAAFFSESADILKAILTLL